MRQGKCLEDNKKKINEYCKKKTKKMLVIFIVIENKSKSIIPQSKETKWHYD